MKYQNILVSIFVIINGFILTGITAQECAKDYDMTEVKWDKLNEIKGKWYPKAWYDSSNIQYMKDVECVYFDYNPQPNNQLVDFNLYRRYKNGTEKNQKHLNVFYDPQDPNAHLYIAQPGADKDVFDKLHIITYDFSSYLINYFCNKDTDGKAKIIFLVLVRDPESNDYTKPENDAVEALGLKDIKDQFQSFDNCQD